MRLMRFGLFILAAASLAACSDSSGCGPTDPKICSANRAAATAVAGTWTLAQVTNGTSVQMHLSAHDTTLSGTGTYSTTGTSAGTVQIRGFVFWRDSFFAPSGFEVPAAPVVILNFVFDNGKTARFDQATLTGQNTLYGVLTFADDNSTSFGVSFIRSPTM